MSASCGGGSVSVPGVRDYRTQNPDQRVTPQSLCYKVPGGYRCPGSSSGTGGKHPVYGTQGPCGSGYLYFSNGCVDDGTNVALYSGWQNWFNWPLVNSAVIKFNDNHFWTQHLECWLTPSTNTDVDSAITHDFNINHFEKAGDPLSVSPPNSHFRLQQQTEKLLISVTAYITMVPGNHRGPLYITFTWSALQ